MSHGEGQYPSKRRRFFVDDDNASPPTLKNVGGDAKQEPPQLSSNGDSGHIERFDLPKDENGEQVPCQQSNGLNLTSQQPLPPSDATANEAENAAEGRDENGNGEAIVHNGNGDDFNTGLFTSIIGENLPQPVVEKIQETASNDIERAVNIYFDGSWKNESTETDDVPPIQDQTASNGTPTSVAPQNGQAFTSQPSARYVGAFGVAGWATRSGTGLLKHGEHVNIERSKSQPIIKRGRMVNTRKEDILTRFTNKSNQEIGRLPRETASWVSTLIDNRICRFEGTCVFVPDRLRVNDTVYLQLRCYLLKEAFEPGVGRDSIDDNRSTGIFEENESTEEKNLRLRQVALVKLFDEICLKPTSMSETASKQKKEGLLRATEMTDQSEKGKKEKDKATKDDKAAKGDPEHLSEEDEEEELQEDQLDTLYKKAQSFDFNMPESEPAPTFTLELRRYQKQALHWMLAKEQDTKMSREMSIHPLWEEYTWPLKDTDDNPLPVIEGLEHFYVNPYSGELSLRFPVQDQRCLGGILADEMGLGKTIEMLSLIHSNRIQPDDPAVESAAPANTPKSRMAVSPAPYTTLVVAPTSLLSQWENEALKASQGVMNVLTYYGNDKAVNLRDICAAGNGASAPTVIVTSYGVVLAEFRSFTSRLLSESAEYGGLFSVEFFRIILDEAHLIKNRGSKSAKSCYELKAAHRWVLSGTPIVNRLEDLFSLVRFLKVEPWNNFSFWKTFITVPFESKDYVRALNVVQTILEPLVLRRTKMMKTPDGEPLVPLPPRTIGIEEVELSDHEREIYDFIYKRVRQAFNSNVEAGTLLKSFTAIFAQILRLRQTCCHPILVRNRALVADEEDSAEAAGKTSELQDDMDLQELIDRFTTATENAHDNEQKPDHATIFTAHALRQIQNESSGECPICSEEPMIDPAVTPCWHSACKGCLESYIRHQTDKGESPRCFSCRAPISSRDIFEVVYRGPPKSQEEPGSSPPASSQTASSVSLRRVNPLSPSAYTSAKIHALINHLVRHPPNTKSVVFSQFTSFLDLIGPQLERVGIGYLRLDGTMSYQARAKVLNEFNQAGTIYEEEDMNEEDNDGDDSLPSSSSPSSSYHQKRSRGTGGPSTGTSSAKTKMPSVLLTSLRAGGVGLNLTAASKVYMMDPWWSFAVEAQAIDRVHRMGQLNDVSVTRFIVKDSIEGRMLRVQDRKMNIAGSLGLRVGGDGSEDEKKKERVEELKLLFE